MAVEAQAPSHGSGVAIMPLLHPAPTTLDQSTHLATRELTASLALAAHNASHTEAAGAGVYSPVFPRGYLAAPMHARLSRG